MEARKPLEGKVAVVTGASRGIGAAIATELATLGADVAITARTASRDSGELGSLQEVAGLIQGLGREVLTVQADLLNAEDLASVAPKVLGTFGRVDILVNNAAYMADEMYQGFWEIEPEAWRAQVELNLNVPFSLMKAMVPRMTELGGGRVINITTMSPGPIAVTTQDDSLMPGNGGVGACYYASKTALTVMSNLFAYELRARNVAVIPVYPGYVATENALLISERYGFDISLAVPMAVPAKAIAFLATCDDAMAYSGEYLIAPDFVKEHGLVPAG